jgi:hypothetical protein
MKAQYLAHSAESLLWALEQIPAGRHHVIPLPVFGEWSVARIFYHVLWFESKIIVPYLHYWFKDAAKPDFSDFAYDQEAQDWQSAERGISVLVAKFEIYHHLLLDAYAALSAANWAQEKETVFGAVSLHWLMTKVYQTRIAQTERLLDMALHWDLHLLALKEARLQEGREKDNQ